MSAVALAGQGGSIARRGYHVAYRGGGADVCPGCGRSHFHVGRVSAECAFCGTALPLVGAPNSGGGGSWQRGRKVPT
jgi:hypothetical protein